MKEKFLRLAKNFSISAVEYAIQANGDLGIRNSGKTYTAMKAAEQLLIAKIPIIVLDPSGVWKNIRHGVNGKKGFPVIVAGGDDKSDIILTPENAVHIVRAAMKSGVSIILDLYSRNLATKSIWNRIVHDVMEVLMYENTTLRHIFLEEAAEFIPQMIQPDQRKVYSSVERIVRIGRNASLGITVINQRAEEINKAILELCALVFLHKQTGKNSLLSISKWFNVIGWNKDNVSAMVTQLPAFAKGECLIVESQDVKGGIIQKSHILPKQTFHPSPEKSEPVKSAKSNVNISQFIKKLNKQLNKKEEKKAGKKERTFTADKIAAAITGNRNSFNEAKELKKQLSEKEKTISIIKASNVQYQGQLMTAKKEIAHLIKLNDDKVHLCNVAHIQLSGIVKEKKFVSKVQDVKPMPVSISFPSMKLAKQPEPSLTTDLEISMNGKDSALNRMIKGVSMFPQTGISKAKLAILCGMSPTSGTFGVYHRKLKRDYIIMEEGKNFFPTKQGVNLAVGLPALKTSLDDILDNWYSILGKDGGLTRILKSVATGHGNAVSLDTIEAETGMVGSSGTFGVYKRKLRRYGLIDINRNGFSLSHNLLMPQQH